MSIGISIGATAKVYCVHNRQKRRVTEMVFDPVQTKIHLCACCENVFLERSDTPMFCPECRHAPVYALGGPLPTPIGALK